ncbi:unnamed protein product [Owenia fusiformis]|uniref:Uncharacterized protein n=1 Tax=Owenia fusiformis TaxID=6347 RepID=A0A8J1YC28_OWEFU|nr:unnamed protein product [Owenia fusiformis]
MVRLLNTSMVWVPSMLLLVATLNVGGGYTQELTQKELQFVDDLIRELMKCNDIVGMPLTLVRGGKTVLAKGYGLAEDYSDDKRDVPVTNKTIFPMASVSKHFTGTIISHLIQNTNITWDSPVSDIMRSLGEEFHFYDPWLTKEVSLRDVIAHKTGIPGHPTLMAADVFSREEIIPRLRFLRPTKPLRLQWNYNNPLYALLGIIPQKMTGKTWEELVKQELYDKLDMNDSSFLDWGPRTNWTDWARWHITVSGQSLSGPLDLTSFSGMGRALGPGAGVALTAEDAGKWLSFQLTHGKDANGRQVVSEDVINKMREASIVFTRHPNPRNTLPVAPYSHGTDRYGQGIFIGWHRGLPLYQHSGGMGGYSSHMAMLPTANIGVSMARNSLGDPFGFLRASQALFDMLLGETPLYNSSTICNPNNLGHERPGDVKDEDLGFTRLIPSLLREAVPDIKKELHKSPNTMTPKAFALKTLLEKIGKQSGLQFEYPRVPKQRHRTRRDISAYLGIYGNFAYGNVTILFDPEVPDNSSLILRYGILNFELFPGNKTDHFELDVLWFIPQTVRFWSSKGNSVIDRMEAQLDPTDDRYIYEKGLKLSDVPPPNTGEWPTAPPSVSTTPSPTSGVNKLKIHHTWILFLVCMTRGLIINMHYERT